MAPTTAEVSHMVTMAPPPYSKSGIVLSVSSCQNKQLVEPMTRNQTMSKTRIETASISSIAVLIVRLIRSSHRKLHKLQSQKNNNTVKKDVLFAML